MIFRRRKRTIEDENWADCSFGHQRCKSCGVVRHLVAADGRPVHMSKCPRKPENRIAALELECGIGQS